jgi:16S rRNA (adenine1518-N6/adenine1519-N6)-dimethyltransferase
MVIKLTRNIKEKAKDEEKFYKLIKDAFHQKRKNLKNNLKNYNLNNIEKILKESSKDLTNRAEELTVSEFIKISNQLD